MCNLHKVIGSHLKASIIFQIGIKNIIFAFLTFNFFKAFHFFLIFSHLFFFSALTPFLFSTDLFLSHTHRRAGVPSSSWWRELSRALLKPCCRGHVDTLKLFSAACEVVKELCNTGDWRCEFHASCSSEPPSFCFCFCLFSFILSITALSLWQ